MSGIAAVIKIANSNTERRRKVNRSLLSAQEKFFEFQCKQFNAGNQQQRKDDRDDD